MTNYCLRPKNLSNKSIPNSQKLGKKIGNLGFSKTYSEEKVAQIDEAVAQFVEKAHQRVTGILSERRQILDDLAHLLSQKEIVLGEELRKVLSEFKPKPATLSPG